MARASRPRRKTTTQRGLGWRHQQAVDAVMRCVAMEYTLPKWLWHRLTPTPKNIEGGGVGSYLTSCQDIFLPAPTKWPGVVGGQAISASRVPRNPLQRMHFRAIGA